ncbi:MAG TPA: MFS transporter [Thermoleophilia bacterium]|nr:MFS transporter [Thermoleophilia bacterium]
MAKETAVGNGAAGTAAKASGLVLLTLASGQFLMTLDSSVMNVSIAQVAEDVGTTVTGVQTAITLYTLVMATLMILGGKLGSILGRRRAFALGCVIYGAGSLTTALAPNLPVLIIGWSGLEGIGAALIMPAIVALVAGNFAAAERPRAYGLIAAAGAMAVAAGPLIGGAVTTYASWRYVFAGEVVVVIIILIVARRIADAPVEARPRLDLIGALLAAAGLGATVYGLLKTSVWGWIQPRPDGPDILGLSPSICLIAVGLGIVWVFFLWQHHLEGRGKEPLLSPSLLENRQLSGGLVSFFFQYVLQAGVFFLVPLFLSVVLELTALQTGVRLLPLSLALLVTAAGVPRLFPKASPRLVVRVGLLAMLLGIVVLMTGIDLDATAAIVAVPMLLIGAGIGALASQLGSVTVSAVPDKRSPEVGGLQNTVTNLGASVGTAVAGSILILILTSAFIQGIQQNPDVPDGVKQQASVELAGGIPFISNSDLETAMADAGASGEVTQAVLDANAQGRVAGLKTALAVLTIVGVVALFTTRRIPRAPVGAP